MYFTYLELMLKYYTVSYATEETRKDANRVILSDFRVYTTLYTYTITKIRTSIQAEIGQENKCMN